MTDERHAEATPTDVQQLEYVWCEYKYRHDLCWRAVYKVSFAVVFLSAIPYVKDDITKSLNCWMLSLPGIGAILAFFGIFLVKNELTIFAKTKAAHHTLQDLLWDNVIADKSLRDKAKHDLKADDLAWTYFDIYVMSYMVVLFLLSVANILFLAVRWIPALIDMPSTMARSKDLCVFVC